MGMILDRIGLLLRRGLAWWIDAFLAAAVIVVARWAINALADAPLTGQALEIYNAVALALVFYAYRVWAEATKATSLGKWSLKLEIIAPHPGARGLLAQFLAVTFYAHTDGSAVYCAVVTRRPKRECPRLRSNTV